MTTLPQSLDLARGAAAALDAGDVAALAALMTDDVRLQFGSQEAIVGKEAFIAAVEASLASVAGFRHEILEAWDVGEAVVLEMTVHYRRLDGSEIRLPCCNIFRLSGGRIADYRVYMDIAPVYAG
ncbi:nuclear transport factor 2 family protein [Candidatus Solirubrobacter pratensis]|uniref:nuclear transport factor 2 family protein n=1 Tax=Candidatus Solirubrobacter pratensis TaxID=1298857 RepID=UPI000418D6F8|nr:nuclear transport factor 2 family protein [Candidatus Solirubrobacter pratensis]